MEISGIEHLIVTAGDFERSKDSYRELLPVPGMTLVQTVGQLQRYSAIW